MKAATVLYPAAPARRAHRRQQRQEWNVGLAEDVRDREFARKFLLAAMDEGVPIQIALAKVIRAMGVKKFAGEVQMASPNVLLAIRPRRNRTQVTLNLLLKPFRLRLILARLDGPKGRHAA
jgi:DNA-binding phage protein